MKREGCIFLTSSMTCGILTGCVEGQLPPVLVPENAAGPFEGYATWDLWSGESRFLPSQQLACVLVTAQYMYEVGYRKRNVRRVQNVTADAAGACSCGEAFGVQLGILTWGCVVAAEVGGAVAAEACLRFEVLAYAVGGVADEHAEALASESGGRCPYKWDGLLTGLKAVTCPLPPET